MAILDRPLSELQDACTAFPAFAEKKAAANARR